MNDYVESDMEAQRADEDPEYLDRCDAEALTSKSATRHTSIICSRNAGHDTQIKAYSVLLMPLQVIQHRLDNQHCYAQNRVFVDSGTTKTWKHAALQNVQRVSR